MKNRLVHVLIFCLTLSKSLCFSDGTGSYESILNDIGKQFFAGLSRSLGNNELFGIDGTNNDISLDGHDLKSYSADEDPYYPMVTVDPLGTAVGTVMRTYLDKPFYSFMGIRFATADTFQMPQIYEEPWETDFMGGYDATYLHKKCPQASMYFRNPTGTEDCLFLNVFTPAEDELDPDKTYPVMVFIHGGVFLIGDVSIYVPSRLIERDVIVVVIQYRLGSLGFLYSGTTSAPGNMGLMDQVTALRWVKKYIHYFNGDDENITVFGQSAGAASTSWMQFTPQTTADYNDGNQLLNRLITQSGSALEFWTLDRDYQTSIVLHGEATGCYEEGYTPDDIVACMVDLPLNTLIEGYYTVVVEDYQKGGFGFKGICPVIQAELLANITGDQQLIEELIVIPKDPEEMIAAGEFLHVNSMAGSVRDEGAIIIGAAHEFYLAPNDLIDDEMFLRHELIPLFVDSFDIEDITGAVSNSLRLAFLPNADMGNWTEISGGTVDYGGMLFLKSGSWRLTQLLTAANPDNDIFFYSFEFESDDSIFDWAFFGNPDLPVEGGITHTDDLYYFFAFPGSYDAREQQTIEKMTTLWGNFAYNGDPTPDSDTSSWNSLTPKWLPYSFAKENILLMQDEFTQSEDFVLRWNYNMM